MKLIYGRMIALLGIALATVLPSHAIDVPLTDDGFTQGNLAPIFHWG